MDQVQPYNLRTPPVATVPPTGEGPDWIDRRASAQALRAAQARQASGRRRFIDPTTCDRDYSDAELEFMQAMQEYKVRSGRMFPTWSEVLEVLRGLGYCKAANALPNPPAAAGADFPPRPRGHDEGP